MAGYSQTSQARKLGIKPGLRVALDHAPGGWALGDPPDDIVYVGIVDVKVAAIDADWSGQRYVWRKEPRSKPNP